MLEFFNEMKLSLDGSINSDQEENMSFEELVLSQDTKPFPVLD